MLGKTEGRRRRGYQGMRQLDCTTDAMDMNLGKLWEMVRNREACMHGVSPRVTKSWTQLKRLSTHPYRATVSQRELYSILYNDLNGNIIYMYTYLMCMHMKIPESPLGSKETKPFSLKGNQS